MFRNWGGGGLFAIQRGVVQVVFRHMIRVVDGPCVFDTATERAFARFMFVKTMSYKERTPKRRSCPTMGAKYALLTCVFRRG